MSKIAAIVAAAIGGAFMGAQIMFPQQMSVLLFGRSLDDLLADDETRARAAVYKLLIDPRSAAFQNVRRVEAANEKFVCGKVNSRDRSGAYAGHRAFVYERATDMARIDDDGRITVTSAAFTPCPVAEEGEPAPQAITISPGALEMAGKILQALPKVEVQGVPAAAAVAPGPGGASAAGGSSGALQPGLQSLSMAVAPSDRKTGGKSAGANPSAARPSGNGDDRERDWHGDRAPAAWPILAADDPLAKPTGKRSNAEALALASEVERRWTSVEAGRSKPKPSRTETREALRALLTIDPASKDFPQAWSLFVRLRKIDREADPKET